MKTQKHIITAVINLLEEHSFQDITIQMILDEAEVSRSTFYRYYLDKYDVVGLFLKSHLIDIFSGYNGNNIKDILVSIFDLFVQYDNLFSKVYSLKGKNSLLDYLYFYLKEEFARIYLECNNKNKLDDEEKYMFTYMVSGQIHVVYRWFRNKHKESSDYMGEILYQLIPFESIK